jgi:hypothetical protein
MYTSEESYLYEGPGGVAYWPRTLDDGRTADEAKAAQLKMEWHYGMGA